MDFKLQVTDSKSSARTGEITTDHGKIQTPIFMPVGTVGTVKGIHISDVKDDINAEIILGNTYHLYLRPGLEIIEQAGGLHKFNGWDRPILTDSGGYQVYSLAHRRKLTEEGVIFQSHIDGSRHNFNPEHVIDIQRTIGADIMMAFDECTPYPCDYDYAKKSMGLTHRWLDRCITRVSETKSKYGYEQTLFPIVQGSTYRDLRTQSAEYIASRGADGNAIGGLSVGEPHEIMYEMTELVCSILPKDKPRYLMGVGTPANILEGIALGVDMFDCVMPTRNGRNGMIFTQNGILNMKNEKWKNDFSLVDPDGTSFVDHNYTKAYLRHLFVSKELLGGMIASQHNLAFYLWLVREARKHIIAGDFAEWKDKMVVKVSQRL
ncbi:MAG: tRNA guanosine(34) transglycosylase Tgt [Bacteroidota bacterium]